MITTNKIYSDVKGIPLPKTKPFGLFSRPKYREKIQIRAVYIKKAKNPRQWKLGWKGNTSYSQV
jgi:hypothetical protein